MSENVFVEHTPESAPAAARRPMEATVRRLGRLSAPVALLASSPQLLDGFLKLSGLFEATTLDPVAREVVIMAVAAHHECHVCVAMHTAALERVGADTALIGALRERRPLPEPRLEALRAFTLAVIASAGAVDDGDLRGFLDHGYTPQNALEVVLGVGTYTLSAFANRLTRAPLDHALHGHAWQPPTR